jgi:hypothetical protein
MLASAIARTHVAETAGLHPGTALLCRFFAVRGDGDPDEMRLLERCFQLMAWVTRHGGVIAETGRASQESDAIMVVALLSVAQAVAMLAAEAHEEIREGGVLAAFPRGIPGVEDQVLGEWIGRGEEDARRLGVERLARLLSTTGMDGDVETAADGLWTGCGY